MGAIESLKKRITGYTDKTMDNRQTGAGAYFKNYDVETDTFTSAVESGKLIGATQGGGSVSIKAIITTTEVDGIPSDAVGMNDIDGWEVNMKANIIEVTPDVIKATLGAANVEDKLLGGLNYKKITGKTYLEETDYLDNITFLGTMSGYDNPVIVQIYNAIAVDGLNITPQDKKTTIVPTNFKAHSKFGQLDEPPFAIFVPVKTSTGSETSSETSSETNI